jgi:hypothetical protein
VKTTFILGGQVLAESADAKAPREIMFYAGTPVLRTDGRKMFHLSFSMEPGAVDLSLLNSGRAPFVVDHVEDIDHTLGVIERAEIKGTGRAFVRFSDRQEMAGLIGDIKSGVLANVSMGARITGELVKAEPVEKGIPHLRATKWQPFHVSLVSRGADPSAQFLSDCQMEVPAELFTDLSAPTGAASEADQSEQKARLALAIKQRRFRVLGR